MCLILAGGHLPNPGGLAAGVRGHRADTMRIRSAVIALVAALAAGPAGAAHAAHVHLTTADS